MKKKYDIFISYRREGGFETAQMISQHLKYKGYNVFFDLENLRESGKFNERLISVIENCKDFVVVFPPDHIERLYSEDDWVRTELACAIRNQKNIIPILLRDFKFPKELPDNINEVRFYQGVAAGDYNYFDASMEKLKQLLKSKRGFTWQRYKVAILSIIGVLAIALSAISLVWWSNQAEYKSLCKDICSTMGAEIIMINGVVGEINDIEKEWKNYTDKLSRIRNINDAEKLYADFSDRIKYFRDKQRIFRNKKNLTESERKLLRKNNIEIEDIEGFFNIILPAFYEEIYHTFDKLLFYATPNNYLINYESSNHFVELNCKSNRLSAESLYISYLGVMSLMPKNEVNPIIDKIKINLFNLPQIDNDKSYKYYENRFERINAELAEMVAKSENVVRREEDVINRVEAFVEDAKRQQEIKQGLERLEDKKAVVANKRAELSEAENKLTEAYERALNKFEIKASDDQWTQWGKMLRIATLANTALKSRTEAKKQYDEQVRIANSKGLDPSFLTPPFYTISVNDMFANIDKWLSSYLKNFPSASNYVTTSKQFYKAVLKGKTAYTGVLVISTQNDETHPVLRIGDIIVERKGEVIRNSDHYGSLASNPVENKIKILRFTSDGTPNYVTEIIPAECKVLVGMLDLTENE